jgi:CRISPR/Cas system endoribonuclease Cas6 (RAMP superfamily)
VEVSRWRREQLLLSGFSLPLASRVAKDFGYDLHRLIGLVEQGCPPELAVRILAPLEPRAAA